MTKPPLPSSRIRGATMLEVLITIVILAFGLLGIVGLQSKMQVAEVESYQRAQAILLLQDMVDRINANRPTAPSFVSASVFGTGFDDSGCSGATGVALEHCEWHFALKGAAEVRGTTNLGAMIGARGCIEQIQAADPTPGVCTPGIYMVSVAWQGFSTTNVTSASAQTCGSGQYTDDKLRRVIAARVVVGKPECT
jgi:type IV pilus assembly protein PilV